MEVAFSVLDFEKGRNGVAAPITSPRSLDACLRAGYDPNELLPASPESFYKSLDGKRQLTKEEQMKRYEHFEARRAEKVRNVKEVREAIIHGQYFAKNTHKNHISRSKEFASSGACSDVEERAQQIQSGMMEMERRRIEAVKRRQEREIQRMVESEKKMTVLQQKLLQGEQDEIRRLKEHEKKVEEERRVEIERKKERDRELARRAAEEEAQRREIARRDSELKKKVLREAKIAEKIRKQEALERELERIQKLEELRRRTEVIIQAQEQRAELNRKIIEDREARVREQVEEKKRKKAIEIKENRLRAEKKINDALEKNKLIAEKKRSDFDERQAAAMVRAKEKGLELAAKVKQQADARKKKVDARVKRLNDAGQILKDRINGIIKRGEDRSHFYSVIAAENEREMLMRKLQKDMSREDKLENVERIRRIDEFLRLENIRKQYEDDERYEKIKDDQDYLIYQRKITSQQALIRKHRLKEAMDFMRVSNKFTDIEGILNGNDKRRRKKRSKDTMSASTPNLATVS